MTVALTHAGYVFDETRKIWLRSGFRGITYSDGDDVEERIYSIIQNASDITSLSDELQRHCTDWPSTYHLSKQRANILRPFANELTGEILEIGAGCGAITRFLGECGGNILALEGSPRRASIAKSRSRDLKNVAVLAESFEQYETTKQFDAITLIGVLEYADLFITGDNPALEMLKRVRVLLKPTGKLYIAIENQLGLKYFAGALEDHIGQAMYGIENRYHGNQARTFGRNQLQYLLNAAGFDDTEFLAPFPDYKMPSSIVAESAFQKQSFDSSVFAWQSVRRDVQLPYHLVFSPELVWPSVVRNGLGVHLSNSFLIVATPSSAGGKERRELAWHFSTSRRKQYCKKTTFVSDDNDNVSVEYSLLNASTQDSGNEWLELSIPQRAAYRRGQLLSEELISIVTRDDWRLRDVSSFLRKYLSILLNCLGNDDETATHIPIDLVLPSAYFDSIPQNIIVGDTGEIHFIDQEWIAKKPVEAGALVYRTLLSVVSAVTRIGRPHDFVDLTFHEFVVAAMRSLGWKTPEEKLEFYARSEAEIQEAITGLPQNFEHTWQSFNEDILNYENLSTQIGAISRERDSLADQYVALLTERDAIVSQLNDEIARMKDTLSWRLTRPLRAMRSIFNRR